MPWTSKDCPASMRNPPPAIRTKAVEVANALLDAGYDDGSAIRIAIATATAKRWARRRDSFDEALRR